MNAKLLVAVLGVLSSTAALAQGYRRPLPPLPAVAPAPYSSPAFQDDRFDLARLEALLARMDRSSFRAHYFELRQIDNELASVVQSEAIEARLELQRSRGQFHPHAAYFRGGPRAGRDLREVTAREIRLSRIDAIQTDLSRLYGRFNPHSQLAKRDLVVELISLTRQELAMNNHYASRAW